MDPTASASASAPVSLYSASTDLCADAIEFHPSLPGLFALGTYQVDKHADKNEGQDEADARLSYTRRGRMTLHQIRTAAGAGANGSGSEGKNEEEEEEEEEEVQVETLHSVDTAAILDMKWCETPANIGTAGSGSEPAQHHQGTLALADARGSIHLYRLHSHSSSKLGLSHCHQLRLNPHNVLCLSLDWSDRLTPGSCSRSSVGASPSLIVSQSDGTLVHLPHLGVGGVPSPAASSSSSTEDTEGEEEEEEEEEELDEEDPLYPYYHHTSEQDSCPSTGPSPSWEHRPRREEQGMEVWRAHGHEAWIAAGDRRH
ncbi:hypothetical protein OC834_001399 [Tilletia horrida]|nr:hypothetical protein OC834_001399 [Tilletia horrida]